MTTEQGLNEKLAKWAGFKVSTYTYHLDDEGIPLGIWLAPDNSAHIYLPDFTHSLDACFKWLFKPLCDYFVSKSTSYEEYQSLMANFLTNWVKDFVFDQTKHSGTEPSMEATAFCRAIEQLIDREAMSH